MNEDGTTGKPKAKINIYMVVFGTIAAIIVVAALSTIVFNKSLSGKTPNSMVNLTNYGPAPDIQGVSGWINSPPLSVSSLRGKVILVDFWTYSCINCIRTIPQLNAWQREYGSNGLVIIGVHTPEFQFEHNYSNVYAAVQRFGIKYAVALDNNYSTWDAYGNQYWPADYVIDKNGDVRYVNFGEGNYNTTERVIRELLTNASYAVPSNLTNVTGQINFSGIGTPEIYLGFEKARTPIGNREGFSPDQTVNYSSPNVTQNNIVYFSGEWYNAPDGMIAVNNNSKLFLVYRARNLNIVASGNPAIIHLKLDGKSVPQNYLGADSQMGSNGTTAIVGTSRLYSLIYGPSYMWHTIEIDASPGLKIYTFTFG